MEEMMFMLYSPEFVTINSYGKRHFADVTKSRISRRWNYPELSPWVQIVKRVFIRGIQEDSEEKQV